MAKQLEEYRALLVDLPEHGQSAGAGRLTIKHAASEVAETIEKQAGGKAHVVGLSLGAQVAIQLIATAPHLVERAFVSGCVVRPLPIPGLRSYAFLELVCTLYASLRNNRWLIRTNARVVGIPRDRLGDFESDVRRLSPGTLARIVTENQAFGVPRELHGTRVPVLIAFGEKEPRVVKRSAIELVHALRHAKAYVVRRGAHAWPIAEPQLCAEAIRAFLNDAPIPPSFEEIRV